MHKIFLDFDPLSSFDDTLPGAEPAPRLLITLQGEYMQVHVNLRACFRESFIAGVFEGLIWSPWLTAAKSVILYHGSTGTAKTTAAQYCLPNFIWADESLTIFSSYIS